MNKTQREAVNYLKVQARIDSESYYCKQLKIVVDLVKDLERELTGNQNLVNRMCLRDAESQIRRKEFVRREKNPVKENCQNCRHKDMLPTCPHCTKCINGGDGWEPVLKPAKVKKPSRREPFRYACGNCRKMARRQVIGNPARNEFELKSCSICGDNKTDTLHYVSDEQYKLLLCLKGMK